MKIIINRMYAGGYLNLSENMIGHEAINLVETDEGARFIWLNANGKCNQTFDSEEDNIVLLVRNVDEAGVVQVIARAKIKEKVLDGMESSSRYIRESKQPRDRMYYGGKNVYDIFASNRVGHKGEEDTYATFEVEDFRIPKEEMFLTDADDRDNAYSIRTKNVTHFAKSSLRQFIEYDDAPEYMDDAKWYSYNDIPDDRKKLFGTIDNGIQPALTSQGSLFDIIGDTYHELSYSNFLVYFLNQKDILREFAEKVLEIDDLDVENCIISREEYNIDVLIQSSNYVIVIENKIKSGITEGINGTTIKEQIEKMFKEENDVKELERKFLEKYGDSKCHMGGIEYKLNEILEKTEGVSQLSKYYLYAQKIANGREIRCFVLTPEYHTNSLGLNNYFYGEKEYRLKSYKTLKEFFDQYNKKGSLKIRFIQDYIDAIEPHSKSFDNYLEDKLLQRFRNVIGNGKTNEQTRTLNEQLSFFTFEKIASYNVNAELLAKYVMLLRVKYLEFNSDDEKTIAFFSLTDEEIKERITLAGLKYLKKHKKDFSKELSNESLDLICAYGNFKMKYKKVEALEKKLEGSNDCLNKTQVMQKCYEIGNSCECKSELYEVLKNHVSCKRSDFYQGLEEAIPTEENIKRMINDKLKNELEEADKIFEKIKQKKNSKN